VRRFDDFLDKLEPEGTPEHHYNYTQREVEDWFRSWASGDMELMKQYQAMKLQMERDIIYGNLRSKPMERATFEALWGDDHGAE
jgi:hypothetical protein